MSLITARFSTRNTLISGLFILVLLIGNFTAIGQHNHDHTATENVSHSEHNQTDSAMAEGITHTENTGHHDEEAFNTKEVIMEHIADGHDWHLWGHTSLHLPVIVYTDKGLEVFSSGKFNHGHDAYQGKYYTYALDKSHPEKEKLTVVTADGQLDETATSNITDLSITKNVASMMVSMLFLFLIFFSVAAGYKKRGIGAPKGLQSWLEPIILFVRDEIARPNLGENYKKYMPYLLTVFFFIWMNNVLGLVPFFPGGANVTGNIAVTLVLALFTFIITSFSGTKTYWGHVFTPHVPLWLYPLMIPVEIIGLFTKPFALMIRLFANITAGHILVLSLVCLIFIFKSMSVAGVSVPFVVFISVIEMLVAFIQAFIFTILSALYIGMALEKPSADAHH
ncbi:MAG: F0F1 ATP synthase subunit A [Bacteroidia bacterium]|jgi:F-type H+-transporting ATPase subunit a|nr:F0F1 ATP synthase subunit A [Bacteroidia bacterium]